MFEYLKNLLSAQTQNSDIGYNGRTKASTKIQVATCALFIEVAKADSNFTDDEREKIISMMEDLFYLNDEQVNELVAFSEQRSNESVSIYEFASIVDRSFTKDEKYELVKNLWRLIYVDEKLDKYEENLLRKINDILSLEHSDLIAAKMAVKEEMNK